MHSDSIPGKLYSAQQYQYIVVFVEICSKTENLLFQEGNEGISEIQMDELKVMALGIAQKGGNLFCRYFPPSELRIDGRCFKVKLFP